MKLLTNAPAFYNDISESIRAFFDVETITVTEDPTEEADMTVTETLADGFVTDTALFRGQTGTAEATFDPNDPVQEKRARRHTAKLAAYYALKAATGRKMPWGSLTGIRPTKLYRELSPDSIEKLRDHYDLPEQKGRLLERIVHEQEPFFTPDKQDMDVYIGIPFCRTRCTYCSFSTTDSTKGEKLMIPYVAALKREIAETSAYLKEKGRRIRCLYIGGGTPTALTEPLFEEMLECATMHFKPAVEFTVEAGRPDTITERKLRAMKNAGVNRISINPQSMNAETLKIVGRSHTPEEICDCFALARRIGFETINADVIAGLPGETPEIFENTLERVLALEAENITVHTLAIKRGSKLFEKNYRPVNAEDVQAMVEGALETLSARGYEPYYLYRQKYMTGNFENIGYTKPGHTGVYNIDIMEETTDITALGCGAVSKRIIPEENRIERAFNFKSIYEYIDRIGEATARKAELFDFQ